MKLVLEASFDVSLPLGASYGVRDECGLDVARNIGVGVGARDRDVGVGHWIRGLLLVESFFQTFVEECCSHAGGVFFCCRMK